MRLNPYNSIKQTQCNPISYFRTNISILSLKINLCRHAYLFDDWVFRVQLWKSTVTVHDWILMQSFWFSDPLLVIPWSLSDYHSVIGLFRLCAPFPLFNTITREDIMSWFVVIDERTRILYLYIKVNYTSLYARYPIKIEF